MTQVFDDQDVMERLDDDHAMLAELVEVVFQRYVAELSKFREGWSTDELQRCIKYIHSLAGALANIGAERAAAKAREVEASLLQSNFEGASSQFEELEAEIALFKETFERWLSRLTS